MAKVTISFNTDNAAFDGNFEREVSHVLAGVTAAINNARWTGDASGPNAADGVVRDSNGNTIGEWRVESDTDEDDDGQDREGYSDDQDRDSYTA